MRHEKKPIDLPPIDRLCKLFDLDQETGELVWRKRDPSEFDSARMRSIWAKKFAGKKAGCLVAGGYFRVGIDGVVYQVHRIVFAIANRVDPGSACIDHIDGDPGNNKPSNLRRATQSENMRNACIRSDNPVGLKGVHMVRRRYGAKIKVNSKSIHLGVFDTPEEAHRAYCKAAREKYGEFARTDSYEA